MADKVYKLIFTKDDGSEDVVQFTAPQGEPGEPGRDGQPGTNGKDGTDGKDYTLTNTDKQEIAEQVAPLVDAVKTVNGITPDENGNVVVEGGVTQDWVLEQINAAINDSWEASY